jgi:hypothetical protein
MDRKETLDAAAKAVLVDRSATHGGSPESSFTLIARLWSARLGAPVTPAQVAIMMIDLKTARAWANPAHDDNWVDIAGYAACGAEVTSAW